MSRLRSKTDAEGDTVVHVAAGADDPVYLKVLLDHGVDPNTPNARTGEVPLVKVLSISGSSSSSRCFCAPAPM